MTIGTRTSGGWAAGSTSLSVTAPTSIASGDLMVLFVGAKPYNATIATPSGWTRLGTQQTNGSTASGVDTGSVTWSVFYKIAGSSESSISVTVTSGNVALGCCWGYTKTLPAWVPPTAYFGSDTTSASPNSITGSGSSGNVKGGDFILAPHVIAGNDASFGSTHSFSATGLTFGTDTESPSTPGQNTTGDDLAASAQEAAVSSGTASTDVTSSWNFALSGSQTGGGAIVRIREGAALYYSIYTAEKAAPSATQIKAGQDVNGSAAVASGSEASSTADGTFTFSSAATGLSAGTAYKISFVWFDGTNNSNVVTSSTWATTNSGALAATESGSDTAAVTGKVIVAGALAGTESGSDTAAITGKVVVTGAFALTESGADTAAATGKVVIAGSLAATETGEDSAAFFGDNPTPRTGTIVAVESGADTAAISGKVAVSGSLAVTEATGDTAALVGDVIVKGSFAVTETGSDTAHFTSAAGVGGTIAAVETGADTASISGKGQIIYFEVAADSTWTPESAADSTWTKDSYLPKTWARGVR